MLARRHHSRSQENKETTWLLSLVILSVVLPTVGFLWFMSRAMSNERAVMREQAAALTEIQLSKAQRAIDRAIQRIGAASNQVFQQQVNLTDEQRFQRVVKRGLADALICLEPDGSPRFPRLPKSLDELHLTEADEKANALLFRWQESALEDPESSLGILEEFESSQCTQGRGFEGRLIYPNLQLATLQRLASTHPNYSAIAAELTGDLEKRQVPWPTAQRLYLASELRKLGHQILIPGEEAFRLALQALELPLQLGQSSIIESCPGDSGLWRILSENRQFLLLLRESTVEKALEASANRAGNESGVTFEVSSSASEGGVPLSQRAAKWHVALGPDSVQLPANAEQRRAFNLAVGCILLALVGVIATFAIRRFLAQSRLTQLRNDFLSTISHELKTPLASTRMLVDTLVEGKVVEDPDKTRSYLEVIGRENARLSDLVENFLTYSRLESGRMPFDFQPVLPGEIANQALDALENKLEADGVTLDVSIPQDLPYARADEATLAIALVNLLDNACKYSGDVKQIGLQISTHGSEIHFAVTDNGVGLTAAERARVRERFYRVDRQGTSAMSGSGLGLSIVNDIAEAHQGKLLIESLPGHGSVFTLIVPSAGNC